MMQLLWNVLFEVNQTDIFEVNQTDICDAFEVNQTDICDITFIFVH